MTDIYVPPSLCNSQPKRDKLDGLTRRAKRRKLALEDDNERGDAGAIAASIRSAKKAGRPAPIGEPERRLAKRTKSKDKSVKRKKPIGRVASAGFDRDLGQKKGPSEGVRARRGDVVGGMGKKKGKGTKGKRK